MQKLKVEISSRAMQDLLNIQMHYQMHDGVPEKHLTTIFEGIDFVAEFPQAGKAIESNVVLPGYRKWLQDNFWIYYSVDEEIVTVWRVAHSKQDIDEYSLIDY